MPTANYPLYAQRKALRENSWVSRDSLVFIGIHVALIALVLMCIFHQKYGAGAAVFGVSWLLSKAVIDKHPSAIRREQFDRLSEDLKAVSRSLYARIEAGIDGISGAGGETAEHFYDTYTRAIGAERENDLGEFWDAVRQSESAMQEWAAVAPCPPKR